MCGFTFFSIRNPHALAVTSLKLPPVERALDTVPQHPSSRGQVCPQVRAVGVDHVSFPGVAPEHCDLLAWPGKNTASISWRDREFKNNPTAIIRNDFEFSQTQSYQFVRT